MKGGMLMSKIYKGKFTSKELGLYEELDLKDINIILEYQKKLPCLQEDNQSWINTRVLHEQLEVGRDYTTWIKQQIEDLDLEEEKQYSLSKGKTSEQGGRPTLDYYTTIETAKEIAMVAGAKGGRTGDKLKENSKIARKYFIAIEKAFKSRYTRNNERQATIDTYHDLQTIIFADMYKENKLAEYLPKWWNMKVKLNNNTYIINTYAYELHRLNEIIIGMSSREYKEIHGLKDDKAIRNTFTEAQLADYTLLQSKSAEYIKINEMWDTNERLELLEKFYKHYK